ncbi:MAG: rubrerythrin family protein [Deferribacteraceae bacterium]|jgi:rubrerythrin|nr:rubrerythrin family protein [Deferribacteraceae bacterium]
MSKSLKGTNTLLNLMKSFAGESQARNRYQIFAGVAEKEGYIQVANIFNSTADNERVHAKEFYKLIAGTLDKNTTEIVNVNAAYPVVLGDTVANLKAAAAGEHEEAEVLYTAFADEAEKEGFPEIAFKYRKIAAVEDHHEKRYTAVVQSIESGKFYKKESAVAWKCMKCGHIHTGATPPNICPICSHPQGYFELYVENY